MKLLALLISFISITAFAAHKTNGTWEGKMTIIDGSSSPREFDFKLRSSLNKKRLKFTTKNTKQFLFFAGCGRNGIYWRDDYCLEFEIEEDKFTITNVCDDYRPYKTLELIGRNQLLYRCGDTSGYEGKGLLER